MQTLPFAVVVAAKSVRAVFEARLAQAGSTLPAWVVLRLLADEDGTSQQDLAARARIKASTVTRQLDRMEADGFIARYRDTTDRRVVRVFLTPEGRRLHRRLRKVAAGLDADVRSMLTDREARELARVLDRVTEGLEAMHGR